jgi:DNA-binding CsgD family transcriptional regulator
VQDGGYTADTSASTRTRVRRTTGGELCAAERQVAVLAAGGATNGEIAAALFLSVRTVEAHVTRVYRKLDVPSTVELASHSAALR